MQMVLMNIIGDVVDCGNTGYPAVLPGAKNSCQLFAACGSHGVTDEALNSANKPALQSKFLCYLIEDVRFGNAVLRCAGPMSLHISAVANELVAEDGAGGSHGFATVK